MYDFPILPGLVPKFFDVSYLYLRTMAEDESMKTPFWAISLFVESNNLVLWVMM